MNRGWGFHDSVRLAPGEDNLTEEEGVNKGNLVDPIMQ